MKSTSLSLPAVLLGLCLASSANAAEPSWKASLGGRWTAADGAARLFRYGRLQADRFVLRDDKVLRKPDTATERTTVPAGTELAPPQEIDVRSEGKIFHLLFWDGSDNGDFSILAIFPDGNAEPTDVADVRADRETYLGTPMSVGPEDVFAVTHAHLNAGEDHDWEDMYRLRDGRLSLVASAIANSAEGCPSYTEQLRWQARPVAGAPLAAVVASIDLVVDPKDDPSAFSGCKRKESRLRFEDVYQWDAAKRHYLRSGGNLPALSAKEEKLGKEAEAWAKKSAEEGN